MSSANITKLTVKIRTSKSSSLARQADELSLDVRLYFLPH